jgi:hypothetical protein
MMKVDTQKNANVDVNPVIITADGKIVLAKRKKALLGEENGICP